jgi:hypothetical protein
MDDDKYAELYESDVHSLIIECESKGYSGRLSFEKNFSETDQNYDEDYFCYERNLKYLDILAENQEDVLD